MESKKQKINREVKEVYFAIKETMRIMETDYCQSWWLNARNAEVKLELKTPQIVQRAKLLVSKGYLLIDNKNTSTSRGTCFRLTDKIFTTI